MKNPSKEQRKAWNATYYERNKADRLRRNRDVKYATVAFIRQVKSVPCTDCKIEYPYYVMQFDHVRGEKKFNLGEASVRGYSMDKVVAEIAKCEVVCANCHFVRTHERKTMPS